MVGILYTITNKINGKQYVGKTYMELERRIKIHEQDSKKYNRPLYCAFNKYGIDNFYFTQVGMYEEGQLEQEEIWLIKKLDTYKNGYNATLGGDGVRRISHTDEEIIKCFKTTGTLYKTAKKLGYSKDTVQGILKRNGVKTSMNVKVFLVELNIWFDSHSDAGKYIVENDYSISKNSEHVADVICETFSGKRKTAYGFHWKR